MSAAHTPWVAARLDVGHTLIAQLRGIVGRKHKLTDDAAIRRFRTGYRFGAGKALAVVRSGTIVEQWKVLQACVAANVMTASRSNTGCGRCWTAATPNIRPNITSAIFTARSPSLRRSIGNSILATPSTRGSDRHRSSGTIGKRRSS